VECGVWYAVWASEDTGHGNDGGGENCTFQGHGVHKKFGNMRCQQLFDELHGPKEGNF
jgi:hypothetical protein